MFDLLVDDDVSRVAQKVYGRLLRTHPRILVEPADVKAWALARQLRTHRDRVADALEQLVRRGYLVEHGRGTNNVRRITIAVVRVPAEHLPTI
jgi:hypothetical protein